MDLNLIINYKSGCEANCVNACPPQWEITFGQNCYLWNATKLSWMEAEQFCRYLSLTILLDVRSNYSLEVVKSTFYYFLTHVQYAYILQTGNLWTSRSLVWQLTTLKWLVLKDISPRSIGGHLASDTGEDLHNFMQVHC